MSSKFVRPTSDTGVWSSFRNLFGKGLGPQYKIAELRHTSHTGGGDKANRASADTSSVLAASIKELVASSAANSAATKASIEELTAAIVQSSKVASLQWAVSNADLAKFVYYEDRKLVQSGVVVRNILFLFMKDYSSYVPENSYIGKIDDAAGKAAFTAKLLDAIFKLVGKKPRLEIEKDGKAVLSYD